MKLSNLIGANVISIFEGKKVGYVVDVDIDYKSKKISMLKLANDSDEQDYYLDRKNIYAFADGVVLVKNVHAIMLGDKNVSGSPLGKVCVKTNGEKFSVLKDCVVDKNLYIKALEIDGEEVLAGNILNVGDNAIILKSSKSQSLRRFADVATDEQLSFNVSLLKMNDNSRPTLKTISLADDIPKSKDGVVRIAETTIIGKNGEIIVRKGQIVTENILNKLKEQKLQSFL